MPIKSPDASINVGLLAMEACADSAKSMSAQQIADAKTSVNFGKLEDAINDFWYGSAQTGTLDPNGLNNIAFCLQCIAAAAKNGDNNAVTEWQMAYQKASTLAQQATSKADSIMQMSNSQTNTDSSNIQQVMQLSTMMNFIGYVTNLLAKG